MVPGLSCLATSLGAWIGAAFLPGGDAARVRAARAVLVRALRRIARTVQLRAILHKSAARRWLDGNACDRATDSPVAPLDEGARTTW